MQVSRWRGKCCRVGVFVLSVIVVGVHSWCWSPLWAQQWRLGVYGALSIFDAHIQQLPQIAHCCAPYTTTVGWGVGAYGAAALDTLWWSRWWWLLPEIRLGFEWESGAFTEREFLGYGVLSDTAVPVYSQHILQFRFPQLFAELNHRGSIPSAYVREWFAGVRLAIVPAVQVRQVERLEAPAVYRYENGLRERNQFDGTLPALQRWQWGIVAGLRGKAWRLGKWKASPEIRAVFHLRSLLTQQRWRLWNVAVGLSIAVPEHTPLPKSPIPPPPPPPPLVAIELQVNGRSVVGKQSAVGILVPGRWQQWEVEFPGWVFFEKDRVEILPNAPLHTLTQFVEAVAAYVRHHPGNWELWVTASAEEGEEVLRARWEKVRQLLHIARIDSLVQLRTLHFQHLPPYPALQAEQRFLQLRQNGTIPLLKFQREKLLIDPQKVDLTAIARVRSVVPLRERIQRLSIGAQQEEWQGDTVHRTIVVGQSAKEIAVQLQVRDSLGRAVSAQQQVLLYPAYRIDTQRATVWETVGREKPLILGLCYYNTADFYFLDTTALRQVRLHLAQGKPVELWVLSDEFGSEAFNQQLMRRRLRAMLQQLRLSSAAKQQLKVAFKQGAISIMPPPYRYLFNRGVIAWLR